ncbi:MAG: hypothetical protein LUC95_06380 [Lachnospiraceae bacterium]|nr:hypothetical protein [Lachnospiraceae bacterium]
MNLVHMKTKKKTVGIVLAGLAVVAVVAALFITSRGKEESGEDAVASSENAVEADGSIETDVPEADGNTETGTANTGSFSVTETESLAFSQSPSDLLLYDQNPYVLVDGTVFWYEDGAWSTLLDASFSALYPGERFCGLTSDGSIDADLLTQEEYDSYSLTTAGTYYNAEQVVQQTAGKAIVQLGASIFNEGVLVLYEDGTTELFNAGTAYPIAEDLTVAEVSGNYLLTEEGDVYLVNYLFKETFSTLSVTLKQVSAEQIVSIQARPTENLCVGLTDEGTVKIWSVLTEQSESEYTPVLPATEKISMGDNYFVAVGTDGKAHFSHYDPEMGEAVDAYLEAQPGTALEVACEGQRIAVLYDDGRICMIDF